MSAKLVDTVANRLKEAMRDKGDISQAELARRTNIDRSSISLYLSGKYSPKGDKLYSLAEALGVSSAWLAGFDAPKKEDSVKAVSISPHEYAVITAYRNKPELQAAVDKLLDVTEESNIVNIRFAARTGSKKKYLTSDELAAASDDSNLTDEDL